MAERPSSEQWLAVYLPLWPLASDDLREGIYRMSTPDALRHRFIEANPQQISNLLVVDIDHEDAALRAMWARQSWLPNAVVENPVNGHAHAVWALAEPVTRTEYAHRKPLAYAAAVTEGLRRSVDGDRGYSGLMTKNPRHDAWEALWLTDQLYTLPQLHQHLDDAGYMPPPAWRTQRRRDPVGLGRNCTIFETARHWAYREVRNHFGNPDGLHHAISANVHALNADYSEPLPHNEAGHIANSIHRWITTRSRLWNDGPATYEATFTLIQHHRGKKSGQARRATATWRDAVLEAMQ